MSKKLINVMYTYVCLGGQDKLKPYKISKYQYKTIDKYLEIDNFCL